VCNINHTSCCLKCASTKRKLCVCEAERILEKLMLLNVTVKIQKCKSYYDYLHMPILILAEYLTNGSLLKLLCKKWVSSVYKTAAGRNLPTLKVSKTNMKLLQCNPVAMYGHNLATMASIPETNAYGKSNHNCILPHTHKIFITVRDV